jgi:hypothetical protein
MPTPVKNLLALVAVVVALVVGIPMMIQGEEHINLKAETVPNLEQIYTMSAEELHNKPEVTAMVEDGLKPYFIGFGLIFLLVAVAYVLADGEDKLTTLKESEEG